MGDREESVGLPPDSAIELIEQEIPTGEIKSALFDFDGTLSLIREGWRGIMIPMMVEILSDLSTDESGSELHAIVMEYVDRLTGKQTIHQFIQLCDEIRSREGTPLDPVEYKHSFHDRLLDHIDDRLDGLRSQTIDPRDLMVPGSLEILQNLSGRGIDLYLASGTDRGYVVVEAELLGISEYFGDRIFGALDEYQLYSKAQVIQEILQGSDLSGETLAGFGDGFVEIENVRDVGGIPVGVASDEVERHGVNEWKRRRLIKAGADIIIPDFREQEALVKYLFAEPI